MSAANRPPLAVLISGRGSNMGALVRACRAGSLAAEPVLVLADHPDTAGLALARELGVPTQGFAADSRAALEQALEQALDRVGAQVIALAGFMRVLSAAFVARYQGRLFNIHPSLLPAYRGLHTHRRVLEAGDNRHGASVHFVTRELDGGPVILQSEVKVLPGDSEATLARRVLATEHIIYPRALDWFARGRLTWQDKAAWLDGRRLDAPLVEEFRATAPP